MKNKVEILIGSLIIAAISTFGAYVGNKAIAENLYICYLITFTLSFLIWHGNHYVHLRLEQKFPIGSKLKTRVLLQLVINSIYTGVVIFLFLEVYFDTVVERELSFDIAFTEIFTGVSLSLFINALYIGNFLLLKLRQSISESEKLKRENLQSQFEALKNQVNPHFLFNCLNTLATIIPEDPNLSVEFVQKLSNVYRYVLQNKDRELVQLQTELEFLKAYLFLLKIRFAENLVVHIDIPEHMLRWHVAPLTLQMLVENAIKHNVISAANPLKIEVFVDNENALVVRNNLQRKKQAEESTGIGLQNIINRYKFLTSKAVEVLASAENFVVALPILKIENDEYTPH